MYSKNKTKNTKAMFAELCKIKEYLSEVQFWGLGRFDEINAPEEAFKEDGLFEQIYCELLDIFEKDSEYFEKYGFNEDIYKMYNQQLYDTAKFWEDYVLDQIWDLGVWKRYEDYTKHQKLF